MKSVNLHLYDAAIRHQIGILRYSTAAVQSAVKIFNQAIPELLLQISLHDPSDGGGRYSPHRLGELMAALKAKVDHTAASVNSSIKTSVEHLVDHEIENTITALTMAIPIDTTRGIKARKPKPERRTTISLVIGAPSVEQTLAAVEARPFAGKVLGDYFSSMPDALLDPIKRTIAQGFVNGQTTDQIVRSLRGTRAARFTDGIMQQSRRSIERTVRTALNHTATTARDIVYQQNSDILSGVRWCSTLDTRTSDICIALDGEVFPVDSGPRPPAHMNCRSTTTPITKSWEELGFDAQDLPEGTRASMDGQVPDTETYGDWLGRQSESVQDDVLGPTRADLFRDGGLTVDKFVDDANNSLTIDQLRAREASAFDKAGMNA